MKTGAFWAIASALFLIGATMVHNPVIHYVAFGYAFMSVLKAGVES